IRAAVILSEIWRIVAPNETKDLQLLFALYARNQCPQLVKCPKPSWARKSLKNQAKFCSDRLPANWLQKRTIKRRFHLVSRGLSHEQFCINVPVVSLLLRGLFT